MSKIGKWHRSRPTYCKYDR